jgi:preprotein translocase subunit SecY
MQLLTAVIPEWRELKKDTFQRKKINRYSRVLALGIALIQAIGILVGLERVPGLVLKQDIIFRFTTVISIVTASLMVMWLAERISERGIGNGSSVIIFTGIVCSSIPSAIALLIDYLTGSCESKIFYAGATFTLIFTSLIVFCEATRYSVQILFKKSVLSSSQNLSVDISSSYIPIKINPSGVLSVMFADSMMIIPALIIRILDSFFRIKQDLVISLILLLLKAALIVFFSIFCLSFTMNPEDISDNLRSRNAFVPSVNEGKRTAEFFEQVLNRIAVIGCVYMVFVAITPELLAVLFPELRRITLSGTSLLILIGVALEIYSRMAPEPKIKE